MPQKPDNYLVWSILVTVLCCLPGGVYAIIKSTSVDSAYNAGNYELAEKNAAEAKKWCIISAIVGAVLTVFVILLQVVVLAAS